MPASEVPLYAQIGAVLSVVLPAAILAIYKGRKSGADTSPKGEATVIAGSIFDSAVVRELVTTAKALCTEMSDSRAMRHADSLKTQTAIDDNTEAVRALTDQIRRGGMMIPPEMLALLAKLKD